MADPAVPVGKTILELDPQVGAIDLANTFIEIHSDGNAFSVKYALDQLAVSGKSAKEVAQQTHPEIVTDADFIAFITGPAGQNGTNGTNGTAGAKGNDGTNGTNGNDGTDGRDGTDGLDGESAYQLAVVGGFSGTVQQWLLSLKGTNGTNGTDGTNGTNGKSAFQLAQDAGFGGTLSQWLLSLKGVDGTNGTNGTAGTNGKSAYQSALDTGFVGNEAAWILSLKGTNGTNGTNGAAGANGTNGADGKDTPALPMDIAAFWPGSTTANALVTRIPIVRPIEFPINFAASVGRSRVAAASSVSFSIQKNGVEVGVATFFSNNTAAFTTAGGVKQAFAVGDILSIVASTVPDTTLADIGLVLVATRV